MRKLLIAVIVATLASNSLAYYQATQGRWLSRDPINEKGAVSSHISKTKIRKIYGNLYMFCANNPIFYIDNNGLAYFALRPLSGWPWIPLCSHNPLDDRCNTEISHEQLFFEDGKSPANIGFFNDNKIRSDDPGLLKNFKKTKTGYNDCVMRMAVAKTSTKPYSLLGFGKPVKFNCQDYAEALRQTYFRLIRDPAVIKKCCPKKEEIK